jgi:glycogen(starch) synthase
MPSRYEPTGTVALEAAASGAALVVASTGGLASIVEHGVTGIRFPVGEPEGLADAVGALLQDPLFAQTLASRARQMVRDEHSWHAIAARTAAIYDAAVDEAPAFEARRTAAVLGSGLPVVFVPPGNLLADPPAVPVGARPASLVRVAAEEAAWQAGADAARAAIRAENSLWTDAAAREAADRDAAARAAAAPFDVVMAAVERR